MKKCPFCAEDIQDAAIVCKHCGRDIKKGAGRTGSLFWKASPDAGILIDEKVVRRVEPGRPAAVTSPVKAIGMLVLALLALLVLVLALTPPTPPTAGIRPQRTQPTQAVPAQPPAQESTTEYKLAVLNHGGYVAPDDVTVARFRFLLAQLASKYGETPERIGDMSVAGRNSLAEKGVSESLLNIMEGMNQIVDRPGSYGKDPYANFLTLYIVLRTSGKSHAFAINNLTGVVRELGLK